MKEIMELLDTVEKKCDEINLSLPSLPYQVKEIVVKFAPYFSIISVIFGGIAIIVFLAVYISFFGIIGASWMIYGAPLRSGILGWIQMMLLAISFIFTIRAIPGLFARSRDGWLWLFYSQIIMVVVDILGFQIGNIIGIVIGFYFLFQIKTYYTTTTITKI
jgi:CDP-diglyceride synthetase